MTSIDSKVKETIVKVCMYCNNMYDDNYKHIKDLDANITTPITLSHGICKELPCLDQMERAISGYKNATRYRR